jgi:hypothetical protein
MRYILSLCLVIAATWPAQAELFDLAPPGKTSGAREINPTQGLDAQIFFSVSTTTTISSVGIRLEPRSFVNQFTSFVQVWDLIENPNPFDPRRFIPSPVYTSPLSVHSNNGLNWYDAEFNWTLNPGLHWVDVYVALDANVSVFNPFNQSEGPYQAGPFSVQYGTAGIVAGFVPIIPGGAVFGFIPSNNITHLRIGTASVPEPSAIILAVVAAGLLGLYRLRIRK